MRRPNVHLKFCISGRGSDPRAVARRHLPLHDLVQCVHHVARGSLELRKPVAHRPVTCLGSSVTLGGVVKHLVVERLELAVKGLVSKSRERA